MYRAVLLTYSNSPLLSEAYDDTILVLDEKFKDYDTLKAEELWLDAYVDLYDERLKNYECLYGFFARVHTICDNSKITRKKLFRNYPYVTTETSLNKVFRLHDTFCGFFDEAYSARPVFVPDIMGGAYPNHPYNKLINADSVEWTKNSIFRFIHKDDALSNITDNDFKDEPYMILGMKSGLGELENSINRVFGGSKAEIQGFYDIQIKEPSVSGVLPDINYNIESALISQL